LASLRRLAEFFYAGDSVLHRYTLDAFCDALAYSRDDQSFRRNFQALGCFLEDLCQLPVNHLPNLQRRQACRDGIAPRASKLNLYKPLAVVCVKASIQPCVLNALRLADLSHAPEMFFLPFPAIGHQRRFVTELGAAIKKMMQKGILPVRGLSV